MGLIEMWMTRGSRKADAEYKQAQTEYMRQRGSLEQKEIDADQMKIDAGIFTHMLQYSPKSAQSLWDSTFAKRYGEATIEPPKEPGKWKARLKSGTVFMWDENTGEYNLVTSKEAPGLRGMATPKQPKMSDFNSAIRAVLQRYKPVGASDVTMDEDGNVSSGAMAAYEVMAKAAKNGDEQAINDLADYEAMWGRMREIVGLQGRQPPKPLRGYSEPSFEPSSKNMGSPGLSNFGQPNGTTRSFAKPINDEIVAQYLQRANGDRGLAKRMAQQDGYTW